MTIQLTRAQLDTIFDQAALAAPDECCGILVGSEVAGRLEVVEVHPVPNVWEGDKRDRFELDALTHLRRQRESREHGLTIVGYYHSHPQGNASPSAFDAEMAWPGYAYLIVALNRAQPPEVKSWQFDERVGRFTEQAVQIAE